MVGKGMGRLGRGPDTREIMARQHGGVLADHAGAWERGSRGLLLRVAGCRARSWRRDLSGSL